jgi:hypothetical protein
VSRIVVKMPTRGRPQKFVSVLDRYINFCSGLQDVHFLVSMDHDDPSMNNDNMISLLSRMRSQTSNRVHFAFGSSKSKIEACNANIEFMRSLRPDIILLASDDMIPIVSGYDDIIAKDMGRLYPDTDGVLHYDDGFSGKDRLITLSILGRKYFERFGYIYHPEYKSVFSDDEFTQVARLLNKVTYIDRCIIQHQWVGIPYVRASRGEIAPETVSRDAVHERNESQEMYDHDREVYDRHKANNFGVPVKEEINAPVATNA